MPATPHRFANIDALRALAAFFVLWAHTAEYFTAFSPKVGGQWLNDVAVYAGLGQIGVILFFCVSGFVIPATLQGRGWAPARAFLINRFFRMYPLFWLSIPAGVIIIFWLQGMTISLRDVVLNLTMIPQALGAVPVEGLYWTLEVELVFYLACLALFAAGLLQDTRVLVILAAIGLAIMLLFLVLLVAGLNHRIGLGYKKATFFAHLGLMFFGALCRKYQNGTMLRRWEKALASLIVTGWVMVFPAMGFVVAAQEHAAYSTKFHLPFPVALLLFLTGTFAVSHAPGWLAWLGRISYSTYLLHAFVFVLLFKWCAAMGNPAWLQLHLGAYIGVVAIGSALLSALTFRWIERPCIALGRKIAAGAAA